MSPMYHRLRAYAPLRIFIPKLRKVGCDKKLKLWWSFTLHPSSLQFCLSLTSCSRRRLRNYEWLDGGLINEPIAMDTFTRSTGALQSHGIGTLWGQRADRRTRYGQR